MPSLAPLLLPFLFSLQAPAQGTRSPDREFAEEFGSGMKAEWLPPLIERLVLLREIRTAREVEVEYARGTTPRRRLRFDATNDPENGGATLLAALERDFRRRPVMVGSRCGFRTDVTIRTFGPRTLTTELCFGCGLVRVSLPLRNGSRSPVEPVGWGMGDRAGMRAAVHAVFPGVALGHDGE